MARESQSGGGSQELITKVAVLEQTVNGLETALAGKLGIGKVTQSTAVTEAGYAADARQLNPAVGGSLAGIVKTIEMSLSWKHVTVSKAFPDPGKEIDIELPEISGSKEIVAEIGVGGAPELYRTLFLRNGILSGAYLDRAGEQIATVYVTAFFSSGKVRLGTHKKVNLDVRLFSLFYR